MTSFRCEPIATATADAFRRNRRDDRGNDIRVFANAAGGLPCRHCLGEAAVGEEVLLGSYDLPRPLGLYWTPSPIFVHTAACRRYDLVDHVPDIVAKRLVSLRAYGADDMVIYDLGVVTEGHDAQVPLERILADERCAYVNIHTAKPGCMLCRVVRR